MNQEIEYLNRMRKVADYLYDGVPAVGGILVFIRGNYKEREKILTWLVKNEMRGEKLVQLFQNESPDGGGYHLGVTYILSRIKGHKHGTVGIKINELR